MKKVFRYISRYLLLYRLRNKAHLDYRAAGLGKVVVDGCDVKLDGVRGRVKVVEFSGRESCGR